MVKIRTIRDIVNIIETYKLYNNRSITDMPLDFNSYKKWLDTEIRIEKLEAIKGIG